MKSLLTEGFDLVGLTVTTFSSRRAFDIADVFRGKGVKVVIGGVHACLMPEECLQHADAIVIGEAEYVWPQLLKDAAAGALKKTYQQDKPTDMDDVPIPRRDLLRQNSLVGMIQATRGCNHACKFCYLPSVPWHQHRRRSPDKVYEEMKGMKQNVVFFVDDNLFVDEEYAIALCEKIAPLKKAWSVQAPTTITRNPQAAPGHAEIRLLFRAGGLSDRASGLIAAGRRGAEQDRALPGGRPAFSRAWHPGAGVLHLRL